MDAESVISLLPLSPYPSLAHSRHASPPLLAPLPTSRSFLDLSSASASLCSAPPTPPLLALTNSDSASRHQRIQVPTNQDWWKWAAPTMDLAAKTLRNSETAAAIYEENVARTGVRASLEMGTREGRTDEKMVGSWRVGQAIGSGMSGRVRIARSTVTGQFAAIKKIVKPPADHKNAQAADREIIILKLVEHPNIIRLLDVYETAQHTFLITEYCAGGELFSYVADDKLSKCVIHRLFTQLIDALSHLHRMAIAHRDLKLENILVVKDVRGQLSIKLADLGMAAFQSPDELLATSCGSPHYASPEVVSGDTYDGPTTDIWSAGVILFALISRALPFEDDHIPTLLATIKRGRYVISDSIKGDARDLVARMLVVNVEYRIKIYEIQKHPYVVDGGAERYRYQDAELPYPLKIDPLSPEFDPPACCEAVDMSVVESLLVLCKSEVEDHVIKSLLNSHLTKARVFYAILRNFRARPFVSEADKRLQLSGNISTLHPKFRKVIGKQARRALSVPSFPTQPSPPLKFSGFVECGNCHESTRVDGLELNADAIDEEKEKENRRVRLPLIEVEETGRSSDDLLTMLEAGDIPCSTSTASTIAVSFHEGIPSPPSVPIFVEVVAAPKSIGRRIPGRLKEFFGGRKGEEERTSTASPKSPFISLLKRSKGYSSLRAVLSPSLGSPMAHTASDLPLSSISNLSPSPLKASSPINHFFGTSSLFSLKTKRSILAKSTMGKKENAIPSTAPPEPIEHSYFSDGDTTTSSTEIANMLRGLPPSPSPNTGLLPPSSMTKRRPAPLKLADAQPHVFDLEISTARTTFSTASTTFTPEPSGFDWSPTLSRVDKGKSILESTQEESVFGEAIISPAPTTGTSFGLPSSPLPPAGFRKRIVQQHSDVLLESLKREISTYKTLNESLKLENLLLREAVDLGEEDNVVDRFAGGVSENWVEGGASTTTGRSRNYLGSIGLGREEERIWLDFADREGDPP